MDRYKNDHPPYWAICYCYIMCHSPAEDSILIEVQPFSTTDVTVQFKTDSVNPGTAYNSFNIYQTGFETNIQKLHMTASTIKNSVGISKNSLVNNFKVYPNPTNDILNFSNEGSPIKGIRITDAIGAMKVSQEINDDINSIDLSGFPQGIYFLEIVTNQQVYTIKIARN
jgi:hypothetical protein